MKHIINSVYCFPKVLIRGTNVPQLAAPDFDNTDEVLGDIYFMKQKCLRIFNVPSIDR